MNGDDGVLSDGHDETRIGDLAREFRACRRGHQSERRRATRCESRPLTVRVTPGPFEGQPPGAWRDELMDRVRSP